MLSRKEGQTKFEGLILMDKVLHTMCDRHRQSVTDKSKININGHTKRKNCGQLTLCIKELSIILLYAGEDGQLVDGGAGHTGGHTVLQQKHVIRSNFKYATNLPTVVGTPSPPYRPPPSPSPSRCPACHRPPHHCGCPPLPSSWGQIWSTGRRGRNQTLK